MQHIEPHSNAAADRPHKPKISYQECDDIVRRYRDTNDPNASAQLIDAFEGYIVKFYNVIRWGRVAIDDRDIREFIKLYMKNEYCRKHIHQYKRMPLVQQEIHNVSESIRQLCDPYDDDELMNEAIVALMTMAKRYQSPDGNPRFHSYVLQAFHFQLRRQLQTLVSDPIVFKMANNINFRDEYYDNDSDLDSGYDVDSFADKTPTFTIDHSLDSVNDNWILGTTSSEEYRQLSIMERKILKLYYLDNKSDHEIAEELGTCRATVNRRRNKVKGILEETFRESKQIR